MTLFCLVAGVPRPRQDGTACGERRGWGREGSEKSSEKKQEQGCRGDLVTPRTAGKLLSLEFSP